MQKTKYPGVHRHPNGRYRVEVNARCPKTGKRLRKRKTIDVRNATDANEFLVDWRQRLESPSQATRRVRLSTVATAWLDGKLSTLKASTADHYGRVLGCYIIPVLGTIFLDALERADIERWRDAQVAEGLAPTTVNSRLRVLKTMLADECDAEGLRNPAARVGAVPRVGKGRRKERRMVREFDLPRCPDNQLSPEELRRTLAAARDLVPQWYPLLATLAMTGARFGEVSALRWEDVDYTDGSITIRAAHWRGIVGSTKTSDVRVLPLEPELARVLRRHRIELVRDQHPGLPSGLVFPSRVGKAIKGASSLRKPLAAAYSAAGVKRWVTPHGFRRSLNNAVRLHASEIVVRSLTGHSTEEMTSHYSTVAMGEKSKAIRAAYAPVLRAMGSDGDIVET